MPKSAEDRSFFLNLFSARVSLNWELRFRMALQVFVGTRKGAFIFHTEDREHWRLDGPHYLGSIVNHVILDPRDSKHLLMAARTGHLGPTVFRSADGGKSWTEAKTPPAFSGERERSVKRVVWLTPGHSSEPGVWYAGTSPHGLFRSEDHGETWEGVAGFNDNPMQPEWSGEDKGLGTPDGPMLHSILVDPRDAKHMYLGLSGGGIFESTDQGASWAPLNQGVAADFLPDEDPLFGHDPHCVDLHPLNPDRMYHQNHCGIYRLTRPETRWQRIGDNMPKEVGDIGFPIVLHPRKPDTIYVFPMDGTSVWPRTSPDGRPSVYTSDDAGDSWRRLDKGFPENAWWTVKRQCMAHDGQDTLGLYFGTSSGELWQSHDEGESWRCLAQHLPHIYSVETGRLA